MKHVLRKGYWDVVTGHVVRDTLPVHCEAFLTHTHGQVEVDSLDNWASMLKHFLLVNP